MIRDQVAIDKAIKQMRENGLVLKITENSSKVNEKKNNALIGLPHLIKKTEQKFGTIQYNIWNKDMEQIYNLSKLTRLLVCQI